MYHPTKYWKKKNLHLGKTQVSVIFENVLICRYFGPPFAPFFFGMESAVSSIQKHVTVGLTYLACFSLVVHTKCRNKHFVWTANLNLHAKKQNKKDESNLKSRVPESMPQF